MDVKLRKPQQKIRANSAHISAIQQAIELFGLGKLRIRFQR
jgi:hypothetical protein